MKYSIGILLMFFLSIVSCKQDISMYLKPKKTYYGEAFETVDKLEIENQFIEGTYYELYWRDGFPIRYFDYEQKNMFLLLKQYGIKNKTLEITDIEIVVKEIGFEQRIKNNAKTMQVSVKEDVILINLFECMADILITQKDLLKFKNVSNVTVNIKIRQNQNEKILRFDFIPIIKKSSKILNNMMSI